MKFAKSIITTKCTPSVLFDPRLHHYNRHRADTHQNTRPPFCGRKSVRISCIYQSLNIFWRSKTWRTALRLASFTFTSGWFSSAFLHYVTECRFSYVAHGYSDKISTSSGLRLNHIFFSRFDFVPSFFGRNTTSSM